MTSAAIRNALLTWPRATLTGMGPSLSLVSVLCCLLLCWPGRLCWLGRLCRRGRGGLLVGGPELGGQRGELRLEATARVGAGQAADLHRAAALGRGPARARTKTRLRRIMNESSSPPRAAMPQIRAGSWPGSCVMARLTQGT